MELAEDTCPLCGGKNNCAAAAGRPIETCWCYSAKLDKVALARIPEEAQNKYCICPACGQVERTEKT